MTTQTNNENKVPKEKLLKSIISVIKDIVSLNHDTNYSATIETIEKDVEFKGANVWVLFFAIIVASVGLNVNSTAVIIGAMLLSPLMGPINGMGLAVGIADNELLRKSLSNYATMVIISLIASFLYFSISPLSDAQSELLARTSPTIFDVFIAFFGGLAGIIAVSRKDSKVNIIAGVAIATALMPPLCTAGYGLATAQFKYFFGATYLFFINSFFIALSTLIIIKYLRFPTKKYQIPANKRRMKRTLTVFTIVVLIPSVYMAWNVVNEARFDSQVIKYMNAIRKDDMFSSSEIVNEQRHYNRKEKKISFALVGKPLTEKQISHLNNKLVDFNLENTKLVIKQTTGATLDIGEQEGVLGNLLDKKDKIISQKDSVIALLNKSLYRMKQEEGIEVQIGDELVVQYPKITSFSLSQPVYINTQTQKTDTIPTIFITYQKGFSMEDKEKLAAWVKVRLKLDTLKLIDEMQVRK